MSTKASFIASWNDDSRWTQHSIFCYRNFEIVRQALLHNDLGLYSLSLLYDNIHQIQCNLKQMTIACTPFTDFSKKIRILPSSKPWLFMPSLLNYRLYFLILRYINLIGFSLTLIICIFLEKHFFRNGISFATILWNRSNRASLSVINENMRDNF